MAKTGINLQFPWHVVLNIDGTIGIVSEYNVTDETGLAYQKNVIVVVLTAAQQNTLRNFATNNIIPAIKAQEGMP